MTAVPGGIIEYADSQTVSALLNNFAVHGDCFDQLTKPAIPLFFPIRIDGLNRSITLTSRPLSRKYEKQIMRFKSTNTLLLQFLRSIAFSYEETGNTCTTLFLDESDNTLVAFCSTKCSSLKVKGNDILSLCPCVEIAALCVDDRYRYMGIGQTIIRHIIQQICNIKITVGVQLIILFALPEAVQFYLKLNFRKITHGMKIFYSPMHEGCIPMYFTLPRIDIEKRR